MPYGRCSGVNSSKPLVGPPIPIRLFQCTDPNGCLFRDTRDSWLYKIDFNQWVNLVRNGTEETHQVTVLPGANATNECVELLIDGAWFKHDPNNLIVPVPTDPNKPWVGINASNSSFLEQFCEKRNQNAVHDSVAVADPVCSDLHPTWGKRCTESGDWNCMGCGFNVSEKCCLKPYSTPKCSRSSSNESITIEGRYEKARSCGSRPRAAVNVTGGIIDLVNVSCTNATESMAITRSDHAAWYDAAVLELVCGNMKARQPPGYNNGGLSCSDPVDRVFATALVVQLHDDDGRYDGELCSVPNNGDAHTFWNVSTIGKFFGLIDQQHMLDRFDGEWGDAQYSAVSSILNGIWMLDQDPLVLRPHFWEEYLRSSWLDTSLWGTIWAGLMDEHPTFPTNVAYEALYKASKTVPLSSTQLSLYAIPGENRVLNLTQITTDPYGAQFRSTRKRLLRDFWSSALAPVACTNDWQCASFSLGTCDYQPSGPNANAYRTWRNGVPGWYFEHRIQAVGDEGGCECHSNAEEGYWDPTWHCQRCVQGYGPASQDEWDDMVRYNASISGHSLLDDTQIKFCVYPWDDNPILAADSTRTICSGHGKFTDAPLGPISAEFPRPAFVTQRVEWTRLEDPSVCLVYNLTRPNETQLVYLQPNWVKGAPWYADDTSRTHAYFLGHLPTSWRKEGYWQNETSAACVQRNHVDPPQRRLS